MPIDLQPAAVLLARDFEPPTLRWLAIGAGTGILLLLLTALPAVPLHVLMHERGPTQSAALIAGCMVLAFTALKAERLHREWRRIRLRPTITLLSLDRSAIDESLRLNSLSPGVLGRRFRTLVDLWLETGSSVKVLDALESETERFELALQSSFTLPRILTWCIPILGFLGTVIGIGSSVGQFDGLLGDVQDIDNLRRGLTQVTAGLGTAFDTTLLALSISLIVALPLAMVERQELQLLSLIDQILRTSITPVLPDPNTLGSAVDRRTLEVVIGEAVRQLQPLQLAAESPAGEDRSLELALESARFTARELVSELKQLPAFNQDSPSRVSTDLTQALRDYLSAVSERSTSELDLQPVLVALRDQGEQTRAVVLQLLPALQQLKTQLPKQSIPMVSDTVSLTVPPDNASLLNAVVDLQGVITQAADVRRQNDQEQLDLLMHRLLEHQTEQVQQFRDALEQQLAESARLRTSLTQIFSSHVEAASREAQQVIAQAQQQLTGGFSSLLSELQRLHALQRDSNAKDPEALWNAARDDLRSTLSHLHQTQTRELVVAVEQGMEQLSQKLQQNNQQEILQQISALMTTMQITLTALNRPRRVMLMESQDDEVRG
jgi:biopolymer transport protein ExbB/TolQ